MAHAHAHAGHVGGHQRLGTDHAHFGAAERGERVDVGARHARVQHVADDRDREVREVFLVVADRVHVEQPLRRVRVAAVAGVHHVHVRRDVLRDQVGRARLAVAHHEQVGGHGAQVGDGVQQRLALGGRGARDVQVDDVGRQALGRDLEGGARARAVLEEQVEHALAAQQRHLLHIAVRAGKRDELAGGVEDVRDHVTRQPLDRQQVLQFAILGQLRVAEHLGHGRSGAGRVGLGGLRS
ncbi:hypothetical protein D3C72_1378550 [compost metagenome]